MSFVYTLIGIGGQGQSPEILFERRYKNLGMKSIIILPALFLLAAVTAQLVEETPSDNLTEGNEALKSITKFIASLLLTLLQALSTATGDIVDTTKSILFGLFGTLGDILEMFIDVLAELA